MTQNYMPIVWQLLIALGFGAFMIVASTLLGKSSRKNKTKDSPYECGMLELPNSSLMENKFNVKFYVVAMLFVLFDIEVVFLYPWAVNFKNFLASGQAFFYISVMLVFVLILFVAFLYALKRGLLTWGRQ